MSAITNWLEERAVRESRCATRVGTARRSRPLLRGIVSVAGAILLLTLSVSSAAARAPSPPALYEALRTSPVTGLPAGFRAPNTRSKTPGAIPKRHHALGWISIEFNKGNAGIDYVVFPTRPDVLGNFSDALRTYRARKGITRQGCAPDLPRPCVTLRGSVSGIGLTTIGFVAGNVGVSAHTMKSDNRRDTLRLARFALRHLRAVERRVK
jgi:hypothetical protein